MFIWNVRCRLTVGDYTLPEFDATPLLGVSLLVSVMLLVAKWS